MEYRCKFLHLRQEVWEAFIPCPFPIWQKWKFVRVELYIKDIRYWLPREPPCANPFFPFGKSVLFLVTWNKTIYFDPEFWNLKIYALSTLFDILFNKITNYFGKCEFFSGSRWVFYFRSHMPTAEIMHLIREKWVTLPISCMRFDKG